jgi:hypothetical protein
LVKEKDKFRDSIEKHGYKDRADVINALLLAYENTVWGYLSRTEGELYRSKNRFITTHDLARIYDNEGKLRPLVTSKEKLEIGNDADRNYHSFEYVLTLPIAIKALAQLSYSERLSRFEATKLEKWSELQFPAWLPKVETLAEDLVEVMLKVHVRNDKGTLFWGVWQDEHDWSVTAAVVDALSLWCGSLACRWAYNEHTGKVEGDGPEGTDAVERKVVAEFFNLLRAKTSGSQQPRARAEPLDEETKEIVEWLRTLRKLTSMALNFRSANASSDPEKEGLELEHVFMLADMVGQVKYTLGPSAADSELFGHVGKILEDAMRTRASSGERFGNVRMKIIEKYPTAFPEVDLPSSAAAEAPKKRDGKKQNAR